MAPINLNQAYAETKTYLKRLLLTAFYPRWQPSQEIYGMTSVAERNYYQESVNDVAALEGAIVDLGCWLCSTTIPLATAVLSLRKGGQQSAEKIYAFDRFIWEEWMDPYMWNLWGIYKPGESFLPEARKRVAAMGSVVELIPQDLTRYTWEGGPIKILLVDAMKSEELTIAIANSFYPFLVSGGLLIHQDYKHYFTPWIHLLQNRLRDYFSFATDVLEGDTISFRALRPIPLERVREATTNLLTADDSEVQAAIQYSLAMVKADEDKSALAAAHVMHYVHRGDRELARQTRDAYSHLSHPPQSDFHFAQEKLDAMAP